MPIEYVNNEDSESGAGEFLLGDVQIRGVYEVEEKGAGFHEEYKAERERESGGQAEIDEPPAAKITIRAWGTQEDWANLNTLRQQREPFSVSVGPFAFAEMGFKKLSITESGEKPGAKQFDIRLQEFREVIVQRQSLEEALGGGSGGGAAPGDPSGPSGWGPNEGPSVKSDTAPPGGTKSYTVGPGETWGRRVIDQTASGSNAHVSTQGGGWVIQDVGLNGQFNGRALSEGDVFIHARTPNGSGARIQHIYMGDGSSKARDTGIYMNPRSSGDLTLSEINAQRWRDNAMYLSAPHESGSGGVNLLIEDSFAYNNETSSYRMGQGTIRNCVGHHDGSHSGRGNRTIWARPPGVVRVENCDILNSSGHAIMAGAQGRPSQVQLSGSNITGSTTTRHGSSISGSKGGQANVDNYAAGVPGGPRQAAAGVGHAEGGGGGDDGGGDDGS